MIRTWFSLLEQAQHISLGAPEVIHRRLSLFQAQPASTATWIEAHNMVWEKWWAGLEAWQSLWMSAWPGGPLAATKLLSPPTHRDMHRAAQAIDAAMRPVSLRVKGNVKRLRKR